MDVQFTPMWGKRFCNSWVSGDLWRQRPHERLLSEITTDEMGPLVTTILAYPGAPDPQLGVVIMGVPGPCHGLGKNPMAIGSWGTCQATQIDLWGSLPDSTLLVFQMDVTGDVCVCQEVIKPHHLGVVNGQMECPGSGKSGKVG